MPLPKFDKIKKDIGKEDVAREPISEESQQIHAMVDELTLISSAEKKVVNVKVIPRSKLVFNKENDYSQENIEKLAASILHFKLQNIPSGYYDEDEDVYVIENGERRTRALDFLIATYSSNDIDKESSEYALYLLNVKAFEQGYPFNLIERRDKPTTRLDEVMSLLRLEDANLEARFDSEERTVHIQKRIELLKEYNALAGEANQLNIQETIADTYGISLRQAYKHTAVTNLIPELQEEFTKKNINLNDAASMSVLPYETQKIILDMVRAGENVDLLETKKIQEEIERLQQENNLALKSKEKQIETLLNEKSQMEESLTTIVQSVRENAEKETARVRAEIEAEYRNETPDPEKLTALQTRFDDISQKHSDAIKQLDKSKKNASVMENEIIRLKEEMEQLRKGLSADEVVKKTKAELGYQTVFKSLKKSMEEYKQFILDNRGTLIETVPGRIEEDTAVLIKKMNDLQ